MIFCKRKVLGILIFLVSSWVHQGVALGERPTSDTNEGFSRKITLYNEEGGVSVLLYLLKNWKSIESAIMRYEGDDYYQNIKKACISKNLSIESLESVYEYRGDSKDLIKLIYDIPAPVEPLYKISIYISKPCIVDEESIDVLSWVITENAGSFRVVSFIYIQD